MGPNPSTHSEKTASESADIPRWLDELTAVAGSLGAPEFGDRLLAFLNRVVPVDHCAVFTFSPDGRAGHLFTESRLPPATVEEMTRDYVGKYFASDPNFSAVEAATRGAAAPRDPIPQAPDRAFDAEYRNRFFERTGLVDKVSTVADAPGGVVYCNFYRMGDHGSFSPEDWARLKALLPLATNLVAAHYRLRAASAGGVQNRDPRETAQSLIHSVISRAAPPFDRLTLRERAVCARVLLGYSTEAIALDLQIGAASVATYRKRAYAKLGIASQNELFSLCLAAIDSLNAGGGEG
ncbi:MAG TPA: helix-turn-helix transcriptional regulator [Sphingomonadales bacterium]